MNVSDALLTKSDRLRLVHVSTDVSLSQLLEIMIEAQIGSIVIAGPHFAISPMGLVTERSIIEEIARKGPDVFSQTARSLMRAPVPQCRDTDSVGDAMILMTTLRTRYLLVARGEDALGIVSIGDLVKLRIRDAELENSVLRDMAAARLLSTIA